jgi:signal transduction histidine kinase
LIAAPVTLLAVFAILFSSRILRIDSRHPRLFQALGWLAGLILLAYGLQFTGHALFVNQMLMLVMLAYGIVSLAVSGYDVIRQPDRTSAFIFAAYLVFMGAQIISILAALGVLAATLQTVEAWQYGTWVHLLLLHVALVSGLREDRRVARDNELGMRIARAELAEQRRASEEKSRFIEMLAHEINTPLAVIDSAVQSLEMLPGASSNEQRSRHARIRSSVRRVSRLINETASRDRLDNGAWQVRLAEFSAAELIASVIDPLDPALVLGVQGGSLTRPAEVGGQAGTLEIRIAPTLPRLRADARLAEIALSNLLDNARKYGSPGSTIRVEARPSVPDPETRRPGIELSVHSIGPPLPGHVLEQLFQKYFRAQTHPEVPGLGLGLYLVRSIAELHGGRAGVEPAEGSGLRFWICLPDDETR